MYMFNSIFIISKCNCHTISFVSPNTQRTLARLNGELLFDVCKRVKVAYLEHVAVRGPAAHRL